MFFAAFSVASFALTGSILLAGGLHFANNFFASLFSLKTFGVALTPISGVVQGGVGDVYTLVVLVVFGILSAVREKLLSTVGG